MRRFLIGILFLQSVAALAHDPSRPDLNRWFDSLTSGKGPCCAMVDGSTVPDPDWESHNGHYRVRVHRFSHPESEMLWVDVPDEAVVKTPNLIGRAMVWPLYTGGTGVTIRCFMPGTFT
jgi:hypothetical protein